MKQSLQNKFCLTALLSFLGMVTLYGQVLNQPVPADNPNLAGNSPWTAACASADFNDYYVRFTWDTPLVNSDNEFILELSDANGNFDNPLELQSFADKNFEFDFDFNFSVPTNVQGENYRFRVRSTSPALTSPPSDPYPMYYIGFKNPILITREGLDQIPDQGVIQLCDAQSIRLTTLNVPDPENYNFIWEKDGVVQSETSNSITISSNGVYSVQIDYGNTCSGSANTFSNTITVNIIGNIDLSINTPANTSLCPGEALTLSANIDDSNLLFSWIKDGVEVAAPALGANTYTINTNSGAFEGEYQVQIEGQDACLLQSDPITITNSGNFEMTLDNPTSMVLLPGETKILSVTTTANNPAFQWFRDGSMISGETSSSISVNQPGNYFVRTSLNSGTCSGVFVDSEIISVFEPIGFDITIDYITTYTPCESGNVTLGVTLIEAITMDNSRADVTQDMIDAFTYDWYHNNQIFTAAGSSQLDVASSTDNGDFYVEAQVGAYTEISNTIAVSLSAFPDLSITSSGTFFCDDTNSIAIITSTDLTNETYVWTRNGQVISSSEPGITATEIGTYQLAIEKDGCTSLSNTIVIGVFNADNVVIDSETDILLRQGSTQTITAEGAESYEWYDATNNLISSSESADITTEGEHMVMATSGNCQTSIIITVTFIEEFEIPNVITPNGDGVNDSWVIPNSYSNNPEASVTIYSNDGVEVYKSTNYQNNWPESSFPFTRQNTVFYYTVDVNGGIKEKGTITVIK